MIQVTKTNAIFLSPHGTEIKREALMKATNNITATTFMPGSLVAFDGDVLVVGATGDPVAVADISVCSAGSIHDAYVGVGLAGPNKNTRNRVNFRYPAVGEYVRLIVTTPADISAGSYVEPDSDGGVKISTGGNRVAASVGRAVDVVETSRYDSDVQWVVVEIVHPNPTA